jgi:acyl carrier protein
MAHTYEGVLQHVARYLHDTLEGSPEVREDSRLVEDLGVDSLKAFETVGDLEDSYQIVVPLEILQRRQIRTVSDLTREIVRLLEKKG